MFIGLHLESAICPGQAVKQTGMRMSSMISAISVQDRFTTKC